MDAINKEEFIGQFKDEVKDHVSVLSEYILNLEQEGYNLQSLDNLFRHTHSVKGIAKVAGQNAIKEIAHFIEDVLEDIKSYAVSADKNILGILYKCIDIISDATDSISAETESKENNFSAILLNNIKEKYLSFCEKQRKNILAGIPPYLLQILTDDAESSLIKDYNTGRNIFVISADTEKKSFKKEYDQIKNSILTCGTVITKSGNPGFEGGNQRLNISFLISSELTLKELKSKMEKCIVIQLFTGEKEDKELNEGIEDIQEILVEITQNLVSLEFEDEPETPAGNILSILKKLKSSLNKSVFEDNYKGFTDFENTITAFRQNEKKPDEDNINRLLEFIDSLNSTVLDSDVSDEPGEEDSPDNEAGKTVKSEIEVKTDESEAPEDSGRPSDEVTEDSEDEYDDIINELKGGFIEDSLDQLTDLTPKIINLTQEKENIETVNGIFRTFHSFKGAGSTFKLPQITEVAHALETLVDLLKKGKTGVTDQYINYLLEGVDTLTAIFVSARSEKEIGGEYKAILKKLLEYVEILSDKGTAAEQSQPDKKIFVPEKVPPKETQTFVKKKESDTIRVRIEKLDYLLSVFEELILFKNTEDYFLKKFEKLKKASADYLRNFQKSKDELFLSDDMGKEERIEGYFNSLVHNWKQFDESLENILQNLLGNLSTGEFLINDIQEEMLKIRMVPVSTMFHQYHRIIRDISQKNNKSVSFSITGDAIEIDKMILEKINDPIMHILRNCIDHGIEPPEERVKLGKDKSGTIKIDIFQKGNQIVLEISDDGKGIDIERIKQTALKKKILDENVLNTLPEQELIQLIFTPGFSTKKNITEISGRGVGMDVVSTNLQQINGIIDIFTEKGKGTKFVLKAPLTLAIRKAILISENKRYFAITTESIEEVVLVKQKEIENFNQIETIVYNNLTIPLVRLSDALNIQASRSDKFNVPIIIVGAVERKTGIIVDKILYEQEIVIKDFGKLLKKVPKCSGTSILPDGNIALVLDIQTIIDHFHHKKILAVKPAQEKKEDTSSIKILLVEDSSITRNLFKGILETNNYRVKTAGSAEEALGILEKFTPDLVITDIVMPGMNGYDLTKTIKQQHENKDLPVIIVTSKGKEEEKLKGIECGADAYIVKDDFEQQVLLDTIESIV